MVGSKVILHNHDDAIGDVTWFQGEGKPLIAALLDSNANRLKYFSGGTIKDKKVVTINYTVII